MIVCRSCRKTVNGGSTLTCKFRELDVPSLIRVGPGVKFRYLSIMLLLCCSLGVTADLSSGTETYEWGDYGAEYEKTRFSAELGNAGAQYDLGIMYREGHGVPQDNAEAMKWFRMAADLGDAAAQNKLGVMYVEERGIPHNYTEAIKWYRLAAEQGFAPAQYNLGFYPVSTDSLVKGTLASSSVANLRRLAGL